MAKTKPEAKTSFQAPADMSTMFTDEELKELEAKAVTEFETEQKETAADAFIAETKRKLKQKSMFANGKSAEGDDVESVTIDLAPHSPWINVDGRLFYHGLTYSFTRAQAASIKDTMYQTWRHEREVGGANMNAERGVRPLNQRI